MLTDACLERCTFGDDANLRCAVSGGADSAALLLLAHAFGARNDRTVEAVHVNHGLRPDAADDAERVAELASKLGVPFTLFEVEVADGGNLEARAREARHAALGADALLGHTADDLAETVLLQLMRGGALDALASMRPERRPMLALRRSDTRAICEEFGYEPVDDPHNADPRFSRARVRHEVLPLLADVAGRDVVPLLARAASLATDEARHLDAQAAALDVTDAKALSGAPLALARRAVRQWLATQHPPDAAAVERVLDVAAGCIRSTEVSPHTTVSRSGGRLSFSRRDDGVRSAPERG